MKTFFPYRAWLSIVFCGVILSLAATDPAFARRNLVPDLPSVEVNLEPIIWLQQQNMAAPVGEVTSSVPQSQSLPERKIPLMNRGMPGVPNKTSAPAAHQPPASLPFRTAPAQARPKASRRISARPAHRPKRRPQTAPEPEYYEIVPPVRRVSKPEPKKESKPVKITRPGKESHPKSDPFAKTPEPPVVAEPEFTTPDLPDIAKLQDEPVLPKPPEPAAAVPLVMPFDDPVAFEEPMPFDDDMPSLEMPEPMEMPEVELPEVELPDTPPNVAPVGNTAEKLPEPDFDSMDFGDFPTITPPTPAPASNNASGDIAKMERPLMPPQMPAGRPMGMPALPSVEPLSRDAVAPPPPAPNMPPPGDAFSDMPPLPDVPPLAAPAAEQQVASLAPPAPVMPPEPKKTGGKLLLNIEYPQQETQVPVTMQMPLKNLSKDLIKSGQSIRIMGVANPDPDQALAARRAAYSRAMLVRSFLIDNGVSHFNININTRAADSEAEQERVEITTQ